MRRATKLIGIGSLVAALGTGVSTTHVSAGIIDVAKAAGASTFDYCMKTGGRQFICGQMAQAAFQSALQEAMAGASQAGQYIYNNSRLPRGRNYYNPNANANSTPYFVGD